MTHNAEADIPLKPGSMLKPGCVPECPGYAHKYLTREQSLAQKKNGLRTNWRPGKQNLTRSKPMTKNHSGNTEKKYA
jgi:hypothetical protein